MPRPEFTVRVALFDRAIGGVRLEVISDYQQKSVDNFVDSLRAAGLIEIIADRPEMLMFDLLPPGNVVDTREWAIANAERMDALGYNAVMAPRVYTEPPTTPEPREPMVTQIPECPACGLGFGCRCGDRGS